MEHTAFKITLEQIKLPIGDLDYTIPDIQRPIDLEQVEKIVSFQEEFRAKNSAFLIGGTISIVDIGDARYLIDGQHRIAAYKILQERHKIIISPLVDRYRISNGKSPRGKVVASMSALESIYNIVNSCRPIGIAEIGFDKYKVTNNIMRQLTARFGEHIHNKSTKPHKPSINMTTMTNKITALIDTMEKWTTEQNLPIGHHLTMDYLGAIIALNDFYAQKKSEHFQELGVEKAINQIVYQQQKDDKTKAFYLGFWVDFEWIDRVEEHLKNGASFTTMKHFTMAKEAGSRSISKELRMKVWEKTNGTSIKGRCYCCECDITVNKFECGHVIPWSRGGRTTEENLMAICGACNKQMRNMNMEEFRHALAK